MMMIPMILMTTTKTRITMKIATMMMLMLIPIYSNPYHSGLNIFGNDDNNKDQNNVENSDNDDVDVDSNIFKSLSIGTVG